MKTTELIIADLDLSVEENLTDRHFGWIDIEFRVIGDPEYIEEKGLFTAEFGLDIELYTLPNPLVNDIEEQEEIGDIEIEVISVIEGEEQEFEGYINQWKSEEYRSLPFNFRYHIESAFMTEVMSPLANLLDNTFRGIVPQVTFTENTPDIEGENYEIDIDDELNESQVDKLEERVEEFRTDMKEHGDGFVEEVEGITGENLSLDLKTEISFEREDNDDSDDNDTSEEK
jgi:hypothetical protein